MDFEGVGNIKIGIAVIDECLEFYKSDHVDRLS